MGGWANFSLIGTADTREKFRIHRAPIKPDDFLHKMADLEFPKKISHASTTRQIARNSHFRLIENRIVRSNLARAILHPHHRALPRQRGGWN